MVLLDLVLRCDEHDLHRVMWTDDLLEELVRVWVRNGAKSEAAARTIVQQIESTFRTQRIPANEYQRLVCEMPRNDPDDHVYSAAAVAIAPSTLLTANTKDFPIQPLLQKGVVVLHPDAYFVELVMQEPVEVMQVLTEMVEARSRPPMSRFDLLAALKRSGLAKFAEAMKT